MSGFLEVKMSGAVQVASPIISIERKKCSKCGETKKLDDFYKKGSSRKGYRTSCKYCCKMDDKEYLKNNRKKIGETKRRWRENNPEKIRASWNRTALKARQTIRGKLINSIKNGIFKSLHSAKAGKHWEGLVGYTVEDLKKHLEKQFKEGMSWVNYEKYGWHIDHRIPISAFNYEKPNDVDFKICWSLSNLQPMWATDNLRKHNKLTKPFQPSLLI